MSEKGRREVHINVVRVASSLGNVKVFVHITCTFYSIEVSLKTVAEYIANKLVEQENGKVIVHQKEDKKRKYKCTLKREMRVRW